MAIQEITTGNIPFEDVLDTLPEVGEEGKVYGLVIDGTCDHMYRYENGEYVEIFPDPIYNFEFEKFQSSVVETVDAIEEKLDEPFKTIGATEDGIMVSAGETITKAIDLNPPEGYKFGAYREIAVMDASSGGANAKDTILRWFGSTGNGTKANISVRNIGESDALVKITVTVLFYKG